MKLDKEDTYKNEYIVDNLVKDIMNGLKSTPLVRLGFFGEGNPQHDFRYNRVELPISKEYDLRDFGFTYSEREDMVNSPFKYHKAVESAKKDFAYIMAGEMASLSFHFSKDRLDCNISTNMVHREILHNLNINETNLILYPVNKDFYHTKGTEAIVNKLRKFPNVCLQPYMEDPNHRNLKANRLIHLTTDEMRYGHLGYDIFFDVNWKTLNVTLTMHFFYQKEKVNESPKEMCNHKLFDTTPLEQDLVKFKSNVNSTRPGLLDLFNSNYFYCPYIPLQSTDKITKRWPGL